MKIIAIIGASANPTKYGNKAVRAYLKQGYKVWPVNPKAEEIEGLPVYPTILDVPARPDLVSVYLPPTALLPLLKDIASRGCDELWLNPGSESAEVIEEARDIGLNVIQACSIVGVGMSPADM